MKKCLVFEKVPTNLISKAEFIDIVMEWSIGYKKKLICYVNVHSIITALKNSKYLQAQNEADLVYSDGWGPVYASNIFAKGVPERVNAADIIEDFFIRINTPVARLYLLGDTDTVVDLAVKGIKKKHKKLKIVGFHNGFFGVDENEKIIKDIRIKRPNLVLVGMGSPKQELWVRKNWKKLPKAVYWTVGGLFNYISGTRKRAPVWMRNCGLEWLYRFFQEPRRLLYRYTVENLIFVYLCIKYYFKKT